MNERIRVAVQKSGRLTEPSLSLLQRCGVHFARSKDKLFWFGRDFPVDLLMVRDDDIPRMLLGGVCDLGIVGDNTAREEMLLHNGGTGLDRLRPLAFGSCQLSLAVPEDSPVKAVGDIAGLRVATSYPRLTQALLQEHGVEAEVVELSGSVEIAPSLGTAAAISDLVSTGGTLRANHLREVEVLFHSQAALYGRTLESQQPHSELVQRLLARLDGVLAADESKYVMLHAPRAQLDRITELLPGVENPTLMPLEGDPERVALHAVCREGVFWEHLEAMKAAGATAILVMPVEKMLS